MDNKEDSHRPWRTVQHRAAVRRIWVALAAAEPAAREPLASETCSGTRSWQSDEPQNQGSF